MSSPIFPKNRFNYNHIEVIPSDDPVHECDSGVFSETTTLSQFPIYFSRFGNNSSKNSRQFGISRAKTSTKRLISKNGKANVVRSKIPYLWTAYIRDIGNTIVNSHWRWTILCFASSHIFSWLLFAWFYMLTARDNENVSLDNSEAPCLVGINGFAGYFLFSLETQHTIGYGTRYITSNCPETIFLMALHMIMGVAICGGMASIVYTKMIRPNAAHSTSLFSKTAIICQRDGVLSLIFRVRDENNKHRVKTKISAYLVETDKQEPFMKMLNLESPGFLIWPLEIVHQIVKSSPFWDLSAKDLITRRFELVVTLEGVSVATGQCSKIRTSYVSNEVLWGHRFKPCVKFDNKRQVYYVDEVDFNTTEEVLTPLCSAKRLYEVVREISFPISASAIGSPAVSIRLPHEDLLSLEYSSGIGSMREEQFTPITAHPIRKLSVIREYKSVENLKSGNQSNQFVEIHNTDSIEKAQSSTHLQAVEFHKSDDTFQTKLTPNGNRETAEALDIEKLLTTLQNYLEEEESKKSFCETNF